MTLTAGAKVRTPTGDVRTVVNPRYDRGPSVRVVPHVSSVLVLLDDDTAWQPDALEPVMPEVAA